MEGEEDDDGRSPEEIERDSARKQRELQTAAQRAVSESVEDEVRIIVASVDEELKRITRPKGKARDEAGHWKKMSMTLLMAIKLGLLRMPPKH